MTRVFFDAARDDELLALCAQAGLRDVFVGLETPSEVSRHQKKKRQVVGVDLNDQAARLLGRFKDLDSAEAAVWPDIGCAVAVPGRRGARGGGASPPGER